MSEEMLTDWFGPDVKPVRVGVYVTRLASGRVGFSLWDGLEWKRQRPGPKLAAVENDLGAQRKAWRGRRCWVLVSIANPFLSALHGKPYDTYLVFARPGSTKWGALASARPFKSERAAQRFADRFPRLGLTAVLP